eukprot:5523192-Pleurochrysis_carterae.AAC.1
MKGRGTQSRGRHAEARCICGGLITAGESRESGWALERGERRREAERGRRMGARQREWHLGTEKRTQGRVRSSFSVSCASLGIFRFTAADVVSHKRLALSLFLHGGHQLRGFRNSNLGGLLPQACMEEERKEDEAVKGRSGGSWSERTWLRLTAARRRRRRRRRPRAPPPYVGVHRRRSEAL